MEYHIGLRGQAADLAAIEQRLCSTDPAAVVDLAPGGDTLRVSIAVGAAQLVALLRQAGVAVDVGQVALQPSVCCGGCSG